ncbi:hypothetical protein SHIRM173S_08561 [Streptomyces hirsutus]
MRGADRFLGAAGLSTGGREGVAERDVGGPVARGREPTDLSQDLGYGDTGHLYLYVVEPVGQNADTGALRAAERGPRFGATRCSPAGLSRTTASRPPPGAASRTTSPPPARVSC